MSKPEGPMTHINLRLPQYVVDYFRQYSSYTKAMRDVLEQHVIDVDAKEEQDT